MNTNRGKITRIEFDIEYPCGTKKHVTFSNDPQDALHNHHMLSEIEGVFWGSDGSIKSFGAIPKHLNTATIHQQWDRIQDGDSYRPAMVVLKADGSTFVMCGGHENGPHPVRAHDEEYAAV